MKIVCFAFTILFTGTQLFSQQKADVSFVPELANPTYQKEKGPVIQIDEGHHNFHTLKGRYQAFAVLLGLDGYQLEAHKGKFTEKSLSKTDILVVSNALHSTNSEHWYKPVLSAFDEHEIEVLTDWVRKGGSLFLIADHMPMGGAAIALAAAFGFQFTDGFALDTTKRGPDTFARYKGTLLDHIITSGKNDSEYLDSVVSFTGQAFMIPEEAEPLMVFPEGYVILLPDTAWVFDKTTAVKDIGGWSQGAVRKFGDGRIAAFGEAAMFTAQVAGPDKIRVGINSDFAPQNHQFLLNIVHWLDGGLE